MLPRPHAAVRLSIDIDKGRERGRAAVSHSSAHVAPRIGKARGREPRQTKARTDRGHRGAARRSAPGKVSESRRGEAAGARTRRAASMSTPLASAGSGRPRRHRRRRHRAARPRTRHAPPARPCVARPPSRAVGLPPATIPSTHSREPGAGRARSRRGTEQRGPVAGFKAQRFNWLDRATEVRRLRRRRRRRRQRWWWLQP